MGGILRRDLRRLWPVLAFTVVGIQGCSSPERAEEPRVAERAAPRAAIGAEPLDRIAGSCREAGLGEEGVRIFSLTLAEGEHLHLRVRQLGLDVKVTVREPDPSGELVFDGPTGNKGTEDVLFVARGAGEHLFEVERGGESDTDRFEVCVEALRPATEDDRRRDAPVRAYYGVRYVSGLPCARRAEGFETAARLWGTLGDEAARADSLYRLGRVLAAPSCEVRDLRTAADRLLEARSLFQKLGNPVYEALAGDQLGGVWLDLGEPRLARRDYGAVLELWRRLERPSDEASALNGLAFANLRQGRVREAVVHYQQALAIWERLGDLCGAAVTRTDLGTAYALFGETLHARDHYDAALRLFEGCPEPAGKAVTLTKIGDLLAETGDLRGAVGKYREALVLRGDRRGEAVTTNSLALAEARLGNSREAFRSFRSALEVFRQLGEPKSQATVLRNLARLHVDVGDLPQARGYLEEALDLSRGAEDRETEALARLDLARVARLQGDTGEARRRASQAIEVIEQARGTIGRDDLRSSYLARRQDYYDFLVEVLLEGDASPADVVRAFEVTERARARSLLDSVRATAAAPADEEADELAAAIDAAHLEWLVASQTGEVEERRRLEVDLRALLERFRSLSVKPSDAQPSPAWAAVSLDEARDEILDDETLLLVYHLNSSAGYLWAVTPAGVTLHEVAERDEVEALAAEARKALRQPGGRSGPALEELSRRLLAPVADVLAGRRLLLVVPNVLYDFPFAALPDPGPGAGGRPLGVGHEIVYLPSVAVLRALRERAARRGFHGRGAVVIADPVFGAYDVRLEHPVPGAVPGPPVLDPLPDSREEALAVLRWLGEPSRGFFGFTARRELFYGAELAGAGILHVATHSVLDVPAADASGGRLAVPEPADLASLVFSRLDPEGRPLDGFLRAYEIRRLDLPLDLVVLSACRTALGEDVRGEGLVGLSRAFLAAGARQVVASLWDVDDRATATFMERFYAALRAGLPTSRALRDAQAAVRSEPRWREPYFWAGFVLQGDWTSDF